MKPLRSALPYMLLTTCLAGAVLSHGASAQTLYVDPASLSNVAPCNNPAAPCRDLSFAVANAVAGDDINLISLAGGPIVINEAAITIPFSLTITGSGAAVTTIDGGALDRIFRVTGGDFHLRDVTLANGDAGFQNGGAIELVSGNLLLTRTVIESSEALAGGAVAASPGSGTVTIAASTLRDNIASIAGGGVWCDQCGGVTTILSRITDNLSGGMGGGVFTETADLTIWTSRIMRNNADVGGGVWANYGTVQVLDSEVSKNEADTLDGGGLYIGGVLSVQRSTIAENTAATGGGGVYFAGDNQYYSANSTYSKNEAMCGGGITFLPSASGGDILMGTTTFYDNNSTFAGCHEHFVGGFNSFGLYNSIVTGNTAATDPYCSTPMTAGNHNLVDDASCDAGVGFNLGAATGVATTLAYNGGLTRTHLIDPTSNAVDAGNNAACLNPATGSPLVMDQRAAPRPVDFDGNGVSECDVGAMELQP